MSHPLAANEENDFVEINSNNLQRIHNKVTKIGYADGVSDGRDAAFQGSFDAGYFDGLRTGFELGKLHAFYDALSLTLPNNVVNEELLKEKIIYDQLHLAKATGKEHFRYLENPNDNLNDISARQQEYVNVVIGKCADKIPATTNLLTLK